MNHSGMETQLRFDNHLQRFMLRKNHSGMETLFAATFFRRKLFCCVRTIVVWKQVR